jgi:hypothetical protein
VFCVEFLKKFLILNFELKMVKITLDACLVSLYSQVLKAKNVALKALFAKEYL